MNKFLEWLLTPLLRQLKTQKQETSPKTNTSYGG